MPVKNESISVVDEIIQDDEVEQDFMDTLRLWKEVIGPLDSAITFVHNNRFLVEEKEYIINDDPDYRHFLETDLAARLHYYWDWYDDFTLKERNLIDPILDNPIGKDLIDRIWEEYKNFRKMCIFAMFKFKHHEETEGANFGQKKIRSLIFSKLRIIFVAHSGIEPLF